MPEPFIHESTELDERMPEKLWKDRNLIVTRVLLELHKIAKADGSFVVEESLLSLKLKNEWTTANTYFAEFMEQSVVVTGDMNDCYKKETVYEAYINFCARMECKNRKKYEPLSLPALAKKIVESCGGGQVVAKKSRRFGDYRFKNAVHRVAGLKLAGYEVSEENDSEVSDGE